jgi:hypothetical protein
MLLKFGIYKEKNLEEIPLDYLKWLAKPTYSGKFYESIHSTDLKWKVPFDVKIEARAVLEKLGWVLNGTVWEEK